MNPPADENEAETSREEVSGDRGGTDRDAGSGAWTKALRDVAPYLDLGWRLAGTAAGPPFIGFWIDVWLQTTPWALLAGCVLGLSAAILQLKHLQEDLES